MVLFRMARWNQTSIASWSLCKPVTSIITSDACRQLKLKRGVTAYALIKATEVMLIKA